jgi:putative flippase GtrA
VSVLSDFVSRKFGRFLIAGGIAALVNILARLALSPLIAYVPSIVIAYVIGMATAYGLNLRLVFGRGDRGMPVEMTWFVIVNVLAVVQTLVVSIALAWLVLPGLGITRHAETIAHVIGVIVPVFTSFLGHSYWTFRNHARL